jgi:hypothetical protein
LVLPQSDHIVGSALSMTNLNTSIYHVTLQMEGFRQTLLQDSSAAMLAPLGLSSEIVKNKAAFAAHIEAFLNEEGIGGGGSRVDNSATTSRSSSSNSRINDKKMKSTEAAATRMPVFGME